MKIEKVETVYLIMGYFIGFEKYGIHIFYNRKYQRWLVENSTDAESLNSENNNFEPEFNEAGFIINAKFTAFHNSIPLTEKDFIDIQLNRLNVFLELKDLKSMDLLQIQHFKKYLENRSIEYQQSIAETIQKQNEINKYIQSYKHTFFSSLTNKRNEDGKENTLFYGKRTLQLLNRTDKKLNLKENLKDRYDLLNLYNSHLHHLITHIIHLYKAINEYNNTKNTGYLTVIAIKKDEVFNSLKSIKGFSEKIKDDVIDGNTYKAIIIKTYLLSELDVLIAFLDDTIGIDIYKSPLQTDFEAVKIALNTSINLDELSTLVNKPLDLSDNPPVEKNKPKKLKKVLFQFIHNIENKEEFIKELKETFPTEIGKSIKAIIDILTDEKILVYGTKEFKTLYDEIKLSFNRDIGSYNSIQNVKIVDKETTETIYKKLNSLTVRHKIP